MVVMKVTKVMWVIVLVEVMRSQKRITEFGGQYAF